MGYGMNEYDFKKKKSDAEWLADLFDEGMTDQQKYDKLSGFHFMLYNSGYCDSMAGELASGRPSEQALWWAEVCQYKYAIESECQRLKDRVEYYEGETDEEGLAHGKGIWYYINGSRYEGEWNHGLKEGFGTVYKADGNKAYEGEWKNGKKNGFGTDYRKDGTKSYEGFWKNDESCGRGVLVDYRDIRFEGVFKQSPPYGVYGLSKVEYSVITYPDGEVVEGPMENKQHRCIYPNGDVFECEDFIIGTAVGRKTACPRPIRRGIYRFADGGTLSGWWERGYYDGDYRYTAPDGTKEIWRYKDDKLISKTPCEE